MKSWNQVQLLDLYQVIKTVDYSVVEWSSRKKEKDFTQGKTASMFKIWSINFYNPLLFVHVSFSLYLITFSIMEKSSS